MSLTFPKPESRAAIKARRLSRARDRRRACILEVFRREMGRCQGCGRYVVPAWAPEATEFTVGHVHESRPRSLGGDPTNPATAQLLCAPCHQKAHRR